jgi:S-(hydroxymethyl)glutathione dehydrogenase/alcohol dehydrogenase
VTSTAVGGYAEAMLIPEAWVFPVESRLGDDALSLMGCGITSGLGAVFNVAGVRPGASVAILGAGHLGLWMTQGARIAGAERVIVVEPREERRSLARDLGATDVVDATGPEAVDAVRQLTDGRGADYVLEAAGDPTGVEDALLMTDNIGVTVLTCFKHLDAKATFSVTELALRGRDVRGCQNGRVRYFRDVPRFVGMLESGELEWQRMISRRFRIEDIMDAFDDADARRGLTSVLVTG